MPLVASVCALWSNCFIKPNTISWTGWKVSNAMATMGTRLVLRASLSFFTKKRIHCMAIRAPSATKAKSISPRIIQNPGFMYRSFEAKAMGDMAMAPNNTNAATPSNTVATTSQKANQILMEPM